MEKTVKKKENNFPLGFLAGLIIGSVLVFLFGTRKGQKLIDELMEGGENIWQDLDEKLPQPEKRKEIADKTIENVKETFSASASRFFRKNGKKLS